MDLIETLRRIEERASAARNSIAAGREQGLQINGTTALRDCELLARDLRTDLERQQQQEAAA